MRQKYEFVVGDRYNKWTVIGYNKGSKTAIEVQCDCGNTAWVQGWSLVNERSKQCKDCKLKNFSISRKMEAEEALKSRVYTQCKSQAKRRGIEFDVPKEHLLHYAMKKCYYCQAEPNNTMKLPHVDGELKYNGIDRFDSSKGYVVGNILAACWRCNSMKSDMPFDEFVTHIKLLAKRWTHNVLVMSVGESSWINEDLAATLPKKERSDV
jgi:hypothetical protein